MFGLRVFSIVFLLLSVFAFVGSVDHGSVDRGRGYKRVVGCRVIIFQSSGSTSRLRLRYLKSGFETRLKAFREVKKRILVKRFLVRRILV